jgi:thymidine kinase
MSWQTKSNYLKLYIGPMYASKTTSLICEINRYKYLTDKILVINSILDKERRGQNLNSIKSHDKESFPAIMLNNLFELESNYDFRNKFNNADIVLIDEAQFYNDLYDFMGKNLNNVYQKKLFIVSGLSSDSNMEPIGDVIKLVPLADEIIKLSAYCIVCKNGTPASFTKRSKNIDNKSQILVGLNDIYSPVCRMHYLI